MRVAVTGASGFVGRHVLSALALRGDLQVVASSRSCPKEFQATPRLRHVVHDITDHDSAFDALGRPDALIHLAWSGLPNYRSSHHTEVELPRQRAFLTSMIRAGLRRVLVTGTCLEYGMQSGELHEELVSQPTTAYGAAKNTLRQDLESQCKESGCAWTWARLFYAYGEGQAPTSLYSQLLAAIARGDAEFPMSPGDQRRDFLSVTEMASTLAALALDVSGADVVNVCSGQPMRVSDFAQQVLDSHQSPMRLALGRFPYPDYEPFEFWGSAKKIRSLLAARR